MRELEYTVLELVKKLVIFALNLKTKIINVGKRKQHEDALSPNKKQKSLNGK